MENIITAKKQLVAMSVKNFSSTNSSTLEKCPLYIQPHVITILISDNAGRCYNCPDRENEHEAQKMENENTCEDPRALNKA